jgi:hypothetical protein
MKSIYELKLHEITMLNQKIRVIRVPGGWIYERVTKKISDTDNEVIAVFVPYSDEYAPAK